MYSESNEKEDLEKYNNHNLLKLKHIEDMRNSILNFKVLNDKKIFLSTNMSNVSINRCNIILFGPSGSGKSSFIKTLYRAVYATPFLPPEAMSKLIVKETDQNEGTLCFTRLHLKEESTQSSGITICDTRGHIWMNDEEKEQFKVIIEGTVKEDVEIKQNKERSALYLWEFWKKDTELFPLEIFNAKQPGLETIPHNIVLVFDGSIDDIIDPSDEKFYRDLVDITHAKGYNSVHVILTRIDVFEKHIYDKHKSHPISERNSVLNNLKDQKIERIIDILGVKRSNVHFIENYHSDIEENVIEIDYHALKTLSDFINLSEQFILLHLNKNATCFAKCF
jgi:predicted GTPase